jgi:hypothetical protein
VNPPLGTRIRDFVVQRAAPGNRAILIPSTAILGVATSLIAESPDEIGNWLILIGAGIGIYVGDVYGQIENSSQALEKLSKVPRETSRANLLGSIGPKRLELWLFIALLLIFAGLVIRVPLENVPSFVANELNRIQEAIGPFTPTPNPSPSSTQTPIELSPSANAVSTELPVASVVPDTP